MTSIENLIDELVLDSGPMQPAPHPVRLCAKWVGLGVAYLAVALAFSGLRPDWMQKLHQPLFVAELVGLSVLFVTAAASAALYAFPDLYQMRRQAHSPLYAFAAFVVVLVLAWLADNPPAPMPRHSFECTISITLVALLPAFWLVTRLRRLASTHGGFAGGAALSAAFAVGALWLRLYEVNDSILHLIEWHYFPMLAFSAAGFWLGRRILRW